MVSDDWLSCLVQIHYGNHNSVSRQQAFLLPPLTSLRPPFPHHQQAMVQQAVWDVRAIRIYSMDDLMSDIQKGIAEIGFFRKPES